MWRPDRRAPGRIGIKTSKIHVPSALRVFDPIAKQPLGATGTIPSPPDTKRRRPASSEDLKVSSIPTCVQPTTTIVSDSHLEEGCVGQH